MSEIKVEVASNDNDIQMSCTIKGMKVENTELNRLISKYIESHFNSIKRDMNAIKNLSKIETSDRNNAIVAMTLLIMSIAQSNADDFKKEKIEEMIKV